MRYMEKEKVCYLCQNIGIGCQNIDGWGRLMDEVKGTDVDTDVLSQPIEFCPTYLKELMMPIMPGLPPLEDEDEGEEFRIS